MPQAQKDKKEKAMKKKIHNEICGELQPAQVLHFFKEICRIPHGSYHVEEISNALVRFAGERKLECIQDASFNVIIKKKATEGASSQEPVILQGHMDMVLEKEKDCPLDLEQQPVELCCDGEYLYAKGTTLGGDDGIAVAMMMALLDDDSIPHPPLECVFTVNEEVGLLGAAALETDPLEGRRMINLDSEKEGIFIVGCAGGAQEDVHLPIKRKKRAGRRMILTLEGLLGGHSGQCIDMGRANADLVMGRVLQTLSERLPFHLISIEGGQKDNAIPRSCTAELLLDRDVPTAQVEKLIAEQMKHIAAEYRMTDPDITWSVEWKGVCAKPVKALTAKSTKRVISYLMLVPNGVLETEQTKTSGIALPRTSLNLGILKTTEHELYAVHMIRSGINSQRDYVQKRVKTLAAALKGRAETASSYPAWERAEESLLCDKMVEIYERQTSQKPVVAVFHCGLECGLFTDKIKGLDGVSIGPDMKDVHTSNERLSLASTERTWNFLLSVLQEI